MRGKAYASGAKAISSVPGPNRHEASRIVRPTPSRSPIRLAVYAVRELDLSAGTIGIALAIGNLGTLASALTDIDTDLDENGVEMYVTVDKDSAARLGISSRDVNNALYNGFGQRQVATIYDELNQYKVIMGVAQRYAQSPQALGDVHVPGRGAATAAATPAAAPGATRDPSTVQAMAATATAMLPLPAIAKFA